MGSKTLEEWCKENNRIELLAEWHPTRNGELSPSIITYGSKKKVWWICSYDDPKTGKHFDFEWQAKVNSRTGGHSGCPYLSNPPHAVLEGFNDLKTTHPELLEEWDYEKNDIEPNRISFGSEKEIYWKGKCGHVFKQSLLNHVNGGGCPYCAGKNVMSGYNDLETLYPHIVSNWDYNNNEMLPSEIYAHSTKMVWWKCDRGHSYRQSVARKTAVLNPVCPICENRVSMTLEEWCKNNNRLELLEEWNTQKNGELKPDSISYANNIKVWWKCSKGHEWLSLVCNRTKGTGCPYCSGHKVLEGDNDFQTWCISNGQSDLLEEWDYEKNDISPSQISPHNGRKVWWKCSFGHEWKARIGHRTADLHSNGTKCPYCSNRKVLQGYNDLATKMPILAKEWNYKRNGDLKPTEVGIGSHIKVWWVCQYGHEWEAVISERIRRGGSGCPKCSGQGSSLPEQGIAFYLEQICKIEQRIKISGYEIDVYLPDYRIGIEYDGAFFHKSERRKKELEKDQKLAGERIKIIRIKESNKNIVDNNIIYFDTDYLGENYEWAINTLFNLLKSLTGNELFSQMAISMDDDMIKIRERYNLYRRENSLLVLRPDIAKEWHPNKNGILTSEMFTVGANTKVWWRCSLGHEWQACINNRIRGIGCPYCAGKRVLKGFNDLATTNPEIVNDWNFEKNGDLKPYDVTHGTIKKVWWKCSKGHEWEASVVSRIRDKGCPYCLGWRVLKGFNDLESVRPDIAKEWHPTKNGDLKPTDVTRSSNKRIWWLCSTCGYEYQSLVCNLTSMNRTCSCPRCSREKAVVLKNKTIILKRGSLANNFPDIAKEWHPTKNDGLLPTDVLSASGKKVWWKCYKCGSEWQATISNHIKGKGCPKCKLEGSVLLREQKRLLNNGSLAEIFPDIAKEWHPTKNGSLKPSDVTAHSHQKAWWKCSKCDYEYQATIGSLTSAQRICCCPKCSREKSIILREKKRLLKNGSLADLHPDIALEWHPTKNGDLLPADIASASNKKVWWKCSECGNEWQTNVCNHVRSGLGCPKCSKEKRQKTLLIHNGSLAEKYPEIAREWHPVNNGVLLPTDITYGSNKKVWWKCLKCGNEWQVSVKTRTGKKTGCPVCAKRR